MRLDAIENKGLGNILSVSSAAALTSKVSVYTQNAIERLHWPLRLSSLQISESFIKDLGAESKPGNTTRATMIERIFDCYRLINLKGKGLGRLSQSIITAVCDAYAAADEFVRSHREKALADNYKHQESENIK